MRVGPRHRCRRQCSKEQKPFIGVSWETTDQVKTGQDLQASQTVLAFSGGRDTGFAGANGGVGSARTGGGTGCAATGPRRAAPEQGQTSLELELAVARVGCLYPVCLSEGWFVLPATPTGTWSSCRYLHLWCDDVTPPEQNAAILDKGIAYHLKENKQYTCTFVFVLISGAAYKSMVRPPPLVFCTITCGRGVCCFSRASSYCLELFLC